MVESNPTSLTFNQYPFLKTLGLSETNFGCYANGRWSGTGGEFISLNPHNNQPIARIKLASTQEYEECVRAMESERLRWAKTPAPVRGEVVR